VKLIQQEQEWRRPPEPQKLASGKDAQVVLASWSDSEITRPLERISTPPSEQPPGAVRYLML
jgi:hypothetical protein